jgi:hypothetical protein
MAIYIKIRAIATIKIQDPYDNETIEAMKENTFISCPYEITKEDYDYTTIDAD